MESDEEPINSTSSRAEKVQCFARNCFIISACCISVFIIPGYFVYERSTQTNNDTTCEDTIEYEGKTTRSSLPWYMAHGVVYPQVTGDSGELAIWPEEDTSDRIENQLMFINKVNVSDVKTIVVYNKIPKISFTSGQDSFFNCPVVACSFSENIADIETADAVLFTDKDFVLPTFKNSRPAHQVWALFLTQNPYYTKGLEHLSGLINWTSSYRSDSDLVVPHAKWVYYNRSIENLPAACHRNFAEGKTRKVVWFVRDYRQGHRRRKEFAEDLSRYIDVEVYGGTDDYPCPCASQDNCLRLLRKYKFFLAFEKSSCRDYITSGFFISLQQGVLPLVMGASQQDYLKVAPRHSYIHVDEFSSAKRLAEHLHRLDQHDDLYNEFFRWRGTGEWIDTREECRLCALLHSGRTKIYEDVSSWWREHTCLGK